MGEYLCSFLIVLIGFCAGYIFGHIGKMNDYYDQGYQRGLTEAKSFLLELDKNGKL